MLNRVPVSVADRLDRIKTLALVLGINGLRRMGFVNQYEVLFRSGLRVLSGRCSNAKVRKSLSKNFMEGALRWPELPRFEG